MNSAGVHRTRPANTRRQISYGAAPPTPPLRLSDSSRESFSRQVERSFPAITTRIVCEATFQLTPQYRCGDSASPTHPSINHIVRRDIDALPLSQWHRFGNNYGAAVNCHNMSPPLLCSFTNTVCSFGIARAIPHISTSW